LLASDPVYTIQVFSLPDFRVLPDAGSNDDAKGVKERMEGISDLN
jgi:hypothetical protein